MRILEKIFGKSTKNSAKIQEILAEKNVLFSQTDAFVPRHILKKINRASNENFIAQNREIMASGGGNKHFGYFDFDRDGGGEFSPRNPWAMIRVKNEITTLEAMLESILPAFRRGVIGFNDCDDGSREVILKFCEKYRGFIAAEYPHSVILPNPPSVENSFSEYSNFVLNFVPKNEWFVKMDADHIYDAKKLYKSFFIPQNSQDVVSYPYGLFLVRDNEIFMRDFSKDENYTGWLVDYIKDGVLCRGEDNWLINNHAMKFVRSGGGYEKIQIDDIGERRFINAEMSNWHFYYVKPRNKPEHSKADNLVNINDAKNFPYIKTKINPDMFDRARILKIYKNFKWRKND